VPLDTLVEAPFVFALAFGLSLILNSTVVKLIGLLGGSLLLVFAFLQFLQASHQVDLDSVWGHGRGAMHLCRRRRSLSRADGYARVDGGDLRKRWEKREEV
jgi:hypothetical protein